MNDRPTPRPGVLQISPYVPGRSEAGQVETRFKLSSNETPLGASPAAIEALRAGAEALELYPDGGATALREAIAAAYGLNADRIVCGAGSDELLHLLAQAFVGPGDEVIYSEYGFLMYPLSVLSVGGTPVVAPESEHRASVDAILDKVTDRTRMVFLANPNNPTGTYLPFDEVKRLHAGLPSHVVLVLDAAYAEYVRRNDYESGLELVATADNVVMTRTFSKIHGLAALRLGWCYGPPEIVDAVNRIRGPFNVSGPAIAAGVAAIRDSGHLEASVRHNETWLPDVTAALEAIGLEVTRSVGNFILIHFPDRDGFRAQDADAWLLERGIVLRRLEPYRLPNALRMTIGTEEANRATIAALTDFMKRPAA